jgi:hypothetical protein
MSGQRAIFILWQLPARSFGQVVTINQINPLAIIRAVVRSKPRMGTFRRSAEHSAFGEYLSGRGTARNEKNRNNVRDKSQLLDFD